MSLLVLASLIVNDPDALPLTGCDAVEVESELRHLGIEHRQGRRARVRDRRPRGLHVVGNIAGTGVVEAAYVGDDLRLELSVWPSAQVALNCPIITAIPGFCGVNARPADTTAGSPRRVQHRSDCLLGGHRLKAIIDSGGVTERQAPARNLV